MAWQMSTVRDISHHNTIGNYAAFRANAHSVQIKITESTGFIDNAAAQHKNGCSGMQRAPYHFARPISIPQQISHFLNRKAFLGKWERPDMLDCEFAGITGTFIRALKDEYRRQSGISQVQIYIGLHDILTSCPPSQWWDEDVFIQVARYRKIGAPSNPDAWRTHLGFDHIGLSTYQWDNATPFYPGGPIGDISFDRVPVTYGGEMAVDSTDVNKIWGATQGGGAYEGLHYIFRDAADQNPADGYADRIRRDFRRIMTGVPVAIDEATENRIVQKVTDNLTSHFHENPPTFTVDVDNEAIANAVLNGMNKRLEN